VAWVSFSTEIARPRSVRIARRLSFFVGIAICPAGDESSSSPSFALLTRLGFRTTGACHFHAFRFGIGSRKRWAYETEAALVARAAFRAALAASSAPICARVFTTQPISREFDEAGVKRDRRWL
jgi:hypothetical protein